MNISFESAIDARRGMFPETTLKFRRVGSHALPPPAYQTEGAAGLDLSSATDLTLWPGKTLLVPTGWSIEIPEGYEGQIRARSSIAAKHGVIVANAPGCLDSDYRGPVFVILHKLLTDEPSDPFEITTGMRIAQLVIAPVKRCAVAEVGELSTTARGAGGIGSTGR